MTNKILTNYSDDKFRLRAFKDYCESRQRNYSELMQMVSETIQNVPDDEEAVTSIDSYIEDQINAVAASHPDQPLNKAILFNGGYTSIHDILELSIKEVVSGVDGVSTVNLIDASNSIRETLSFNEMVDQLKTNLHSLSVLVAANTAIAENNIADKVTVFNDKLNETFENAYSDLSNTASYYKEALLSQTSIQAYFTALGKVMNLDAMADDNSIELPSNSNIAEFTGASPLTGLASGVTKGFGVIGGVVNAGVKAVKGILGGIVSVGKKVFSWVGKKINQVVANPYDIEVVNSEAESYTIDGWSYSNEATGETSLEFVNKLDNPLIPYIPLDQLQLYVDRLNEHSNKWIKFSTKGGEFIVKYANCHIEPLTNTQNPDYDRKIIFDQIKYSYKPKSLDYNTTIETFKTLYNLRDSSDLVNISDIIRAFESLQQSNSVYADTSDEESYLYKSFCTGIFADQAVSGFAICEALGATKATFPVYEYVSVQAASGNTNADFVAIASGWNRSSTNPIFSSVVSMKKDDGSISNNQAYINVIISRLLMVYAINLQEQFTNPYEFPFLPYREEKEGLSDSRFNVRTDSVNAQAFNNFVAAVTAIVIVAAVAITAVVVVKKVAKALYYKALNKQSVLNQKMWNGESLTPKEMKQYRRATRRLDKSNYLSSGMQSSASGISSQSLNSVSNDLNNSDLYTLIHG